MPQDYEIVKGFKTDDGLGLYDYGSLHNAPDIDKMIEDALEEFVPPVDQTLQHLGQAADAKATGDAINRSLDEAKRYTDGRIGEQIDEAIGELADVYAPKTHNHEMDDVNGLSEAIEGANSAAEQALTDAKTYTNEQLTQYKVSVDTTLKNAGEAADAKAVGDAIGAISAEDVGARPNDWLPSLEEIKAAPAGYGLGEYIGGYTILEDANTAVLSGWYRVAASTKNYGLPFGIIRVEALSSSRLIQTAIIASTAKEYRRSCINGTWSEWQPITEAIGAAIPEDLEQFLNDAKNYTNEQLASFKIEVDPTLSEEGQAADAKAVGDAIGAIDFPVDSVNGKTGNITLSAKDVGATTQEDLDEVAAQKADTVQSKSGSVLVMDNSAATPLNGLKLFGKTAQFKTTGKNLLKNTATTQTVNGVTFTVNADGSVTANGTATGNGVLPIFYDMKLTPNASMIVSGCPSGGGDDRYHIRVYNSSWGTIANDIGDGSTFTVREDGILHVRIGFITGTVFNNLVFYPMIRLASIADETYEPYTGGMASPNPDYPQELNSAGVNGNINITVRGKNLADMKKVEIGKAWNGNAVSNRAVLHIDITPGTSYTISFGSLASIESLHYFTKESAQAVTSLSTSGQVYQTVTFTAPSNGRALCIQFNKENVTQSDIEAVKLQVEVGRTATAYQPYNGQVLAVQTPNGLPGIPVSSGGNYTDENGQNWICDEIDFARGKYVKRVVDLADYWDKIWYYDDYSVFAVNLADFNGIVNGTGLCSHYKRSNAASLRDIENGSYRITTQFFVRDDRYNKSTLTDYRTWMKDNVQLLTILEVPVETDLTIEELAAYSKLHTNHPHTTIFNDSIAEMSATYYTPSTAVQMVHSPKDQGKVLSIDQHGCVTLSEIRIPEVHGFIAQAEPPEDVNMLWIDTDDETGEEGGGGIDEEVLEAYLRDVVYADDEGDTTSAPINADTLGGRPASDYATKSQMEALTAEDVGAAPAGYGLGEDIKGKINLDTVTKSGNYRGEVLAGHYKTITIWVRADMSSPNYGTMTGFSELDGGFTIRRTKNNGVWGEWEWENPPMFLGQEYRTTERWNGKAVWTVLVNCGTVSAGETPITTAFTCSAVIGYRGNSGSYVNPVTYESARDDNYGNKVNVNRSNGVISITFIRGSGLSATAPNHIQVWYTKD